MRSNRADGIQTELQPLTRDKFREVLGDTRSGCYSILLNNEGLQPQEAVDAMVKFLFAKWYDADSVELIGNLDQKQPSTVPRHEAIRTSKRVRRQRTTLAQQRSQSGWR